MKIFKLLLLMIFTFILITGCNNYIPQKNKTLKSNSVTSEFRVIKHDLGETCVPLKPQRIIALDETSMEAMLALELKIIAATQPNIAGSIIPKLEKKAEEIVSLG